MPRRKPQKQSQTPMTKFRFEYVHWTDEQLASLVNHLGKSDASTDDALLEAVESGWKISLSQHEQTGRYLASITDKWNRPGLSGLTYAVEHGDLTKAIRGACYYATEYLDAGVSREERVTDDLW